MSHEDALRRILEAEAAKVEVQPDALSTIRRRIRTRKARWSPLVVLTSAGAAGLAGAAAAAVILAGGGPPTVTPTPGPGGTVSVAPTPPPTVMASPPRTASSDPTAGGTTANLAVYYVGTDRLKAENGAEIARPRLYREYHRVTAGDGGPAARTRAAVTAMLDGRTASDDDYASPWPAGARVREVRLGAGAVTVDLGGAAANDVDAETARVAVQQLVWTATAASGRPAVRLMLDGVPADRLWGHSPAGGELRRAPMLDVVAPVWLISPQDGATVGRSVEVHVAGIVFEATAHLRVRRDGTVVEDRPLTLDAGPPDQGEIKVRLTLPPGTYLVEAYALSAVDGSVQHLDDHTITVR
jgi:hypothetical protein